VFGAVGPMQFEVAVHRLAAEFGCQIRLDHMPYTVVRRLGDPKQRATTNLGNRGEYLTRADGAELVVFNDQTALNVTVRLNEGLLLEPLVAGTT
jgi:peptide chain release factor 3